MRPWVPIWTRRQLAPVGRSTASWQSWLTGQGSKTSLLSSNMCVVIVIQLYMAPTEYTITIDTPLSCSSSVAEELELLRNVYFDEMDIVHLERYTYCTCTCTCACADINVRIVAAIRDVVYIHVHAIPTNPYSYAHVQWSGPPKLPHHPEYCGWQREAVCVSWPFCHPFSPG